jgi:integrase
MKVTIRKKKVSNGRYYSLRLEYYYGYYYKPNGKPFTRKKVETLGLHAYVNPKTKSERQTNKRVWDEAETIRSKREVAAKNDEEGFSRPTALQANFFDYLVKQSKDIHGNTKSGWQGVLRQFGAFAGTDITFNEITQQFCERFKGHLANGAATRSGKPLSFNSQVNYYNKFKAALKAAVREGIIKRNPSEYVTMPNEVETERVFLTQDELQKVINTPCPDNALRAAFLFSCGCGLRYSDIVQLTWRDVHHYPSTDEWFIHFRQQKTKGFEYHPLGTSTDLAPSVMPAERGKNYEKVFPEFRYGTMTNPHLTRWALKAGVDKELTFHAGRHTFAVSFITNGGDIYTLSKLLGHQDIKTTLVYADIIDAKKNQSVQFFPKVG